MDKVIIIVYKIIIIVNNNNKYISRKINSKVICLLSLIILNNLKQVFCLLGNQKTQLQKELKKDYKNNKNNKYNNNKNKNNYNSNNNNKQI